jgi:hypothetical protein
MLTRLREWFVSDPSEIAFRPLYDRGGSLSVYSGPSGPIVTLARIMENVSHGRPAGYGIKPNALNDPNSP